ncbi:MAG: hypothetical protein H8D42_04280 [Candidatus Marinimicrobia bacterium]|nr:hypothetical protein [Candidatus Neomarinimicrobiota bacterium]MBL7067139.1 hypothetical protein [Candidatus Neomarinimicrobiota bacterium]
MIVKNGNIALSGEEDFEHLDIKIEQGKISQIRQNLSVKNEIDAVGLLVFPEGADPHVPGFFGDVSGQ